MVQAITNFNPLPYQPAPILPARPNQKMNIDQVEASEGSLWTAAPAITNILNAPHQMILATGSLIQARTNQDREGELDAGIRLFQQPFSFFSGLGSLMLTITELSVFLKTFGFKHIIPLPPKELGPVASGLGLVLCTLELCIESLGLYRVTSFLSKFYCSSQTKLPNFSENGNAAELKSQIIDWAQRLIDSPELLQAAFNEEDFQALTQHLAVLITALEAEETPLSEEETRTQIEQFLQKVNDQLLVADLQHLHRKYFSLSQSKIDRIYNIARQKFPDLPEAELNVKTDEMASQILTRKGCDLARRVQCWFVRELDEKLEPLITKLSDQDPTVRTQAKAEAQELLKTMDIQARKKMIAHIIGVIASVILITGILIGFTACPFLIPATLLFVGGGLAIARYLFSAGYWNSRGWNFDPINCIPYPIRWIYKKLWKARQIDVEAVSYNSYTYQQPRNFFRSDNPYLFSEPPILQYQLPQSTLDHFVRSCGLRTY